MNYTHVRERQGPDIFALSNVTLCKSSFITIFIVTQKFIRIKAVGWLAFLLALRLVDGVLFLLVFSFSHTHTISHISLEFDKKWHYMNGCPVGLVDKEKAKNHFLPRVPADDNHTKWCELHWVSFERLMLRFNVSVGALFAPSLSYVALFIVLPFHD